MRKLVEVLGLTQDEVDAVGNCVEAIVDGPFIAEGDSEFQTVMGVDRPHLRDFLRTWPDVDASSRNYSIVNNSLLNLVGYPHDFDEQLIEMTELDREAVDRLFIKIRRRAEQTNLLSMSGV